MENFIPKPIYYHKRINFKLSKLKISYFFITKGMRMYSDPKCYNNTRIYIGNISKHIKYNKNKVLYIDVELIKTTSIKYLNENNEIVTKRIKKCDIINNCNLDFYYSTIKFNINKLLFNIIIEINTINGNFYIVVQSNEKTKLHSILEVNIKSTAHQFV
jgi:hypothetical protein